MVRHPFSERGGLGWGGGGGGDRNDVSEAGEKKKNKKLTLGLAAILAFCRTIDMDRESNGFPMSSNYHQRGV